MTFEAVTPACIERILHNVVISVAVVILSALYCVLLGQRVREPAVCIPEELELPLLPCSQLKTVPLLIAQLLRSLQGRLRVHDRLLLLRLLPRLSIEVSSFAKKLDLGLRWFTSFFLSSDCNLTAFNDHFSAAPLEISLH